MKIFSHVAMLLAFCASNMAMWGQTSRTVSFDLNSRHESDYCLGANTNEFTLTIDTKLESIDSLQAYDIALRYDPDKIKIIAALRIGTISSNIKTENFFFKNPERGLTEIIGFTGLGKNSPNLVGEGALIALRGEWLDSKCKDSTVVTIMAIDPGFEFGIGPRYVNVDSSVRIYNRVNDSLNTKMLMRGKSTIHDTLSFEQTRKAFSISRELQFGRAVGNDTIQLQIVVSDSITITSVNIDSVTNVQATVKGNTVSFRKPNRGLNGYTKLHVEIEVHSLADTTRTQLQTTAKATNCDCALSMDSLITDLVLIRQKKQDTVISSVNEDESFQHCTEFYDILGRFIESDCPIYESTKAIRRRKAFKLGNDYIQYIDSK